MFSFDELVKILVFSKLSPSSTFAYFLDHHWDQLVVYLLVAPLQWLHVAHLLRGTAWLTYGHLGKLTVLFYVALVFAAWENIRLFAYIFCRRLQAGYSMQELFAEVISAGRLLGGQVRKQAAPLVSKVIAEGGSPAQSSHCSKQSSPTDSSKEVSYAPETFTKRSDKSD